MKYESYVNPLRVCEINWRVNGNEINDVSVAAAYSGGDRRSEEPSHFIKVTKCDGTRLVTFVVT